MCLGQDANNQTSLLELDGSLLVSRLRGLWVSENLFLRQTPPLQ